MEFTFMIAGIITSIVLAFVGIVKTPLLKYKEKKGAGGPPLALAYT